MDDADLLSDSEEEALLEKLDGISSVQGMDVVIVTVDSTGDRSPMEYADDFYDDYGYGEDGILLLVIPAAPMGAAAVNFKSPGSSGV